MIAMFIALDPVIKFFNFICVYEVRENMQMTRYVRLKYKIARLETIENRYGHALTTD